MAAYRLVIIGAGLSGLAAGIRSARFGHSTLILEQHALPGGLNSYYHRQGRLLETGLHAMTNFAPPGDKQAPLNRLFRQLRLSRRDFAVREQICSEICFPNRRLLFSNDPDLLTDEIGREFPDRLDRFRQMRQRIAEYDPFSPAPWRSARAFLAGQLESPELADMLLLPLMVYGNPEERDMDLGQFVIMFRAVFEEGFFRPAGAIREFLDLLVNQYQDFGGELRHRCPVDEILVEGGRARGVRLADGSELEAEAVLSTAGIPETMRLSGWQGDRAEYTGRMSFLETVSLVDRGRAGVLQDNRTIIFYNNSPAFRYQRPDDLLDTSWGVICFPDHFAGLPPADPLQVRVTNAACYPLWRALSSETYHQAKTEWTAAAVAASEAIVGPYRQAIAMQDSFTPLTIERYTRKAEGAVYGSPVKLRDGVTPWANLFIAGTDQGYLGIVGAMLSGITVVNHHLLH
jgi:phytoene dehydrogenase-like protein